MQWLDISYNKTWWLYSARYLYFLKSIRYISYKTSLKAIHKIITCLKPLAMSNNWWQDEWQTITSVKSFHLWNERPHLTIHWLCFSLIDGNCQMTLVDIVVYRTTQDKNQNVNPISAVYISLLTPCPKVITCILLEYSLYLGQVMIRTSHASVELMVLMYLIRWYCPLIALCLFCDGELCYWFRYTRHISCAHLVNFSAFFLA